MVNAPDVQCGLAMSSVSPAHGALVEPPCGMATGPVVEHALAMAATPGSLVELPGAMAELPSALDALAVAVDGPSPTDAIIVDVRALLPTVPHPAKEYNLPVPDVQRYWP